MKWENLDLHLEILLPGIVTLVLLLSLLPPDTAASFINEPVKRLLENEFPAGALFVASSYMVGVVNFILTRIFLDRMSEVAPRPWLIRRLSRDQLKEKTNSEINREYRGQIARILSSTNDDIKREVQKRRETGKLVRSTLIPVVLVVLVATSGQGWVFKFAVICLVAMLNLIAYAYVEFSIYEECVLHFRDAAQLTP
jgi:hypothetical protein